MNAIQGITVRQFPSHLVKDGMHGIVPNKKAVDASQILLGKARDTFSHLEHINPDSKLAYQAEKIFQKGFNLIKR